MMVRFDGIPSREEYSMADDPGGFANLYIVELLFRQPYIVNKRVLFEAVKKRCPGAQPIDGKLDEGLPMFIHEDHLVEFKEGRLPAQTVVLETTKPIDHARYEAALQQSWSFPKARQTVSGCTASLLITEVLSSRLEYRQRIALFQNFVAGALEAIPCDAIYWQPTEQIIDPKEFRYYFDDPDHPRFALGALNVRLFNIQGTPGERIMDTLGLAALGLPDLQCHFHDLECNDVAALLRSLGLYVFEHGDIIEDGHTVAGILDTEKWRCQHEMALIGPERIVLDIDPGSPFAAGNRHQHE